ncbi:MAG: hypothetical protein D6686_02190 [Alphaproteobacteria bacterium]|nr:MAG: hypothetical protein D6686_02190 [Alphaproteobacteria bacterium]
MRPAPRQQPRRIAGLALAALLVALALAASAQAAGRVALLIGNANYRNSQFQLKNPVNDVRALDAALGGLGFRVIRAEDRDAAGMRAALEAFRAAADRAEIALFFYAGHGVQAGGENYLLGSDLAELSRSAVEAAAVTLSEVQAAIRSARPELGVIILDACRDNPLTRAGAGFVDGPGLRRSSGGAGLLIAYATDPGAVAYDGAGDNSVFTAALLQHIATPGLEIRLMFGRVRQQVVLKTGGQQVPWVEESVLGEHYLNTQPTPQNLAALIDRDVARWREVSGSLEPGPYRAYLEEFPDGLFRDFAERRLARFAREPAGPRPPQGFDAAAFVAAQDHARLYAALQTLGYLPRLPGLPGEAQLKRGLEAYVAQSGDPAAFDGRQLYLEAARVNVFLGTRLGQRIRTDIVALASIDKALEVARATYAEIEAMAAKDPRARAMLDPARADLQAIEAAQFKVLARLDQSREYYAELIETAGRHFDALMTPALLGIDDQAARGLSGLGEEAERDIRLYLKHVRMAANDGTRGTLTWLSDFLPGA